MSRKRALRFEPSRDNSRIVGDSETIPVPCGSSSDGRRSLGREVGESDKWPKVTLVLHAYTLILHTALRSMIEVFLEWLAEKTLWRGTRQCSELLAR